MTHNLQTRSFFARMGQWVSIISIVCQTCSALGNWEVLEWSDCSSLPTLLPQIRSVSQTTPLIMGTRHSACLALSSGLQFPASYRNIQIQQSHLPEKKTEVLPTSCSCQACPAPQYPLLVPSVPDDNSCPAVVGEYLLSLDNRLPSLSGRRCPMCDPPPSPRAESLPLEQAEEEAIKLSMMFSFSSLDQSLRLHESIRLSFLSNNFSLFRRMEVGEKNTRKMHFMISF